MRVCVSACVQGYAPPLCSLLIGPCLLLQVQGMSFIAAVLILNLEEAEAFITFANLLNKPCQMAFFRVDHELVRMHS